MDYIKQKFRNIKKFPTWIFWPLVWLMRLCRILFYRVEIVDPNDFIAMAAQQTNSKVDWYQAMLTKIWKQLPAFALNTEQSSTNSYNTNAQFINQHGKIVSSRHFTKKQKQLWHDYQLVQYDVTAGHHYLVRNGQLK